MDGKIIKRLSELEAKTGSSIEGVFIFRESVGKITVNGKEYTREEWENVCKDNPRIITIIDDIPEVSGE